MAVHLIISLAAKVLCCTLWGRRITRGIVRSWDSAALQSCLINHSPMVVNHPLIQPVWAFVTSQLYEPHLVSHCPGIAVTVGAWLTGVTGKHVPELRALSCLSSFDFNSRTQNGRRGEQEICHRRAMPRLEILLHCQSEIQRCALQLSVSPPLPHVTWLSFPWVCCTVQYISGHFEHFK